MEIKKPILLFDGVCNLCNSSVNFILKWDRKKQFHFVALQSKTGVKLIQTYNISENTDSVIFINENRVFEESEAAIEILKRLPAPWRFFAVFRIIPKKIRDKIYKWIARNRYSWFGKREVCRIL